MKFISLFVLLLSSLILIDKKLFDYSIIWDWNSSEFFMTIFYDVSDVSLVMWMKASIFCKIFSFLLHQKEMSLKFTLYWRELRRMIVFSSYTEHRRIIKSHWEYQEHYSSAKDQAYGKKKQQKGGENFYTFFCALIFSLKHSHLSTEFWSLLVVCLLFFSIFCYVAANSRLLPFLVLTKQMSRIKWTS